MTSSLAFPPARSLSGSVRVPSSKSATNRALVLAALSDTPVVVRRPLESDDTRTLVSCLATMGGRVEESPGEIRLHGPLGVAGVSTTVLNARDSGTAARFLAALAAVTPGDFRLEGSPRLSQRPMSALIAALRRMGAEVREEGADGLLPLRIRGKSLAGGSVRVDASQSSQFLSALLLLGAAGVPLEVGAEGAIASAPYVDMTVESLRAFGHRVTGGAGGPWLVERASAAPDWYVTPGDYSSAVPLLCGVGVCGGEIALDGLRWPSADADAGAIPVLRAMGVTIESAVDEPGRLLARAERGALASITVCATDFPDSVPALAALAAFAPGPSRFEGIGHLRWKESDRIASLERLLSCAGARAFSDGDALVVGGGGQEDEGRTAPGNAEGRLLPTFRDHRIAMAAALLALRLPGLRIEDPDCVSKSYPAFFRDLDRLCMR